MNGGGDKEIEMKTAFLAAFALASLTAGAPLASQSASAATVVTTRTVVRHPIAHRCRVVTRVVRAHGMVRRVTTRRCI